MADITWDDVVDFAPELATFNSDAAQVLVNYANRELFDVGNLGGEDSEKYKLARLLWCAHGATMSKRGGAAGPMTSSSAGRLTRSFAMIAAGTGTWAATAFGQMLGDILKTTGARMGTAG